MKTFQIESYTVTTKNDKYTHAAVVLVDGVIGNNFHKGLPMPNFASSRELAIKAADAKTRQVEKFFADKGEKHLIEVRIYEAI